MHKHEILLIHQLLAQVRCHMETRGLAHATQFVRYDRLSVRPTHVHREKRHHQRAVFVLGQEIHEAFLRARGLDVDQFAVSSPVVRRYAKVRR